MARLDPDTCDHLTRGGILLTANRRQARFLQARHAEAMRAEGRGVWPTPGIMPLDAWLAAAFREARAGGWAPAGRLLDEDAALWLWRDVVAVEVSDTLHEPVALATRARRAWLSLRLHGGDSTRLAVAAGTGNQLLLLRWIQRAEARLAELDALDCGLLRLHALPLLRATARSGVMLCGVDASTPGLGGLAALGDAIRWLRPSCWPADARPAQVCAAVDPDAELEAAIDWLLDRMQQQPEGHFGLIVPDLGLQRAEVERRLAAALQPSLELPGRLEDDRVFDVAGGPPLAVQGVIATALDLLRLDAGPVPFALLTRLLRSDGLAGSDVERDARVRLDVALREQQCPSWSPARVAKLARRHGCPVFADRLEQQAAQRPAGAEPAALHEHSRGITARLDAWGWPGPGPLGSDVYQAVQEWQSRLRRLATASLARPFTWFGAVDELLRLCQAPFQPERGLPRLLVLDSLEEVGVPLDGLWVTGLAAERWPRPAAPDPLLPVALQRTLGIATALPSGQLAQARRVQAAWHRCTRELVLSWALQRDDATHRPSPLLPREANVVSLVAHRRRAGLLQQAARHIESLVDERAPALQLPSRATGGARVLELQAQCPFRGFAELRLGAGLLQEPAPGVPARLRGQLLHEALRVVWTELGGSRSLRALNLAEREARVRSAVAQAGELLDLGRLGFRTAALEREWQETALGHQLASDLCRPEFEVAATEVTYHVDFSGVPLELRIDRIDRIGAHRVLIDYKTSRTVTVRHWSGMRPSAPQLPLYAVTCDPAPDGVAFAVVARDAAPLRGVAADGSLLGPAFDLTQLPPDKDGWRPADWQELRTRWQSVLSRLAADFAAGNAAVDPRDSEACRRCHLKLLCRIAAVDGESAGMAPEVMGAAGGDRDG